MERKMQNKRSLIYESTTPVKAWVSITDIHPEMLHIDPVSLRLIVPKRRIIIEE
jgi:hypothetical protein